MKRKIQLVRFAVLLGILAFSHVLSAQISGTVFRDFNANGVMDLAETATNWVVPTRCEVGVQGVTVKAFDASNAQIGATAVTDYLGNWSIASGGIQVRIEFTVPQGLYAAAAEPAMSHTFVAFSEEFTDPSQIDLGIQSPSDYSQSEPILATPCYYLEEAQQYPNTHAGFVSFGYSSGTPASTVLGNSANVGVPLAHPISIPFNQIGSTYGVAVHKTTKSFLLASHLNQGMSFGPLSNGGTLGNESTGAIYRVDASSGSQTNATLWLDFNVLFGANTTGPNTNPSLSSADWVHDHDPDYAGASMPHVLKLSFGDIEMSDDDQDLYILNLYGTPSLYRIPVGSALTAPASTSGITVTSVPSSPSAAQGDVMRPHALKFYNGLLYVGMVNDAAGSKNLNNLTAYVYTYNPATNTFSGSPVISFPLGNHALYPRQSGKIGEAPTGNWWYWFDDYADFPATELTPGTDNLLGGSQPALADIEFTSNGNMIIGMMDRFGIQYRWGPAPAPLIAMGQQNTTTGHYPAGEILQASNNGDGTWTLENNGGVDSDRDGVVEFSTQSGASGGNGPGGQKFFYRHEYSSHGNVVLGAIAMAPGFKHVAAVTYNAGYPFSGQSNTGGIRWFNVETGELEQVYRLYDEDIDPDVLGKGFGFGDIEVMTDANPNLEIGNRVWADTDADGIQDPGEPAISGVEIQLYNASGTVVATKSTDSNGRYYFDQADGLIHGTDYWIAVAGSNLNGSGELEVGGMNFGTPTMVDATLPGTLDNQIDSDALRGGSPIVAVNAGNLPYIHVTAGGLGQNNHSYDFGFSAAAACTVTINSATPSACDPATNTYSLTVNVNWANASGTTLTVTTTAPGATPQTITTTAGSSGTQSVTFTGLTPGVAMYNVTAQFGAGCTATTTNAFTAPPACSGCPTGNCGSTTFLKRT